MTLDATTAPVAPQVVRDLIGAALTDALDRETPDNQFTPGELADIVVDWALPVHERMIRQRVAAESSVHPGVAAELEHAQATLARVHDVLGQLHSLAAGTAFPAYRDACLDVAGLLVAALKGGEQ